MIQHEVVLHHLAIKTKGVFDETLSERRCQVPCTFGQKRQQTQVDHLLDFYFAPNVIHGRVDRSQLEDQDEVPFDIFVAYPLLPPRPDGGELLKFTGSDTIGTEPSDPINAAIHSFAHFSLFYSRGSLVFTDLQGLHDKAGKICLFDVQAHTYVSTL